MMTAMVMKMGLKKKGHLSQSQASKRERTQVPQSRARGRARKVRKRRGKKPRRIRRKKPKQRRRSVKQEKPKRKRKRMNERRKHRRRRKSERSRGVPGRWGVTECIQYGMIGFTLGTIVDFHNLYQLSVRCWASSQTESVT